jgi:hypothetical protein
VKTETLNDKYKPVPLNLKKEVVRAIRRPGFASSCLRSFLSLV